MLGILIFLFAPIIQTPATVVSLQTPKIDGLDANTTQETPPIRLGENDYSRERLIRYVGEKSVLYGLTKEKYEELMYTIEGESSWRWFAYNKDDEKYVKGGSRGVGQWTLPTWALFNKLRGIKLDIENPLDQLDHMTWAFSTGKESNWSVWCKRFGLGLKRCRWANGK